MSDNHPPPWINKNVLNPAVAFIVGTLGIPLRGGAMLTVAGRTTGSPHSVPVYPMALNGQRYLVAPRGLTAWVRNLRAAGGGELRLGRERKRFVATEVADDAKPEILRAYLDRWYLEAGSEFGVPKTATLAEIADIAHRHPVFHIQPAVSSS